MSTTESREGVLPLQTRLAPIASVEAEARTVEVIWTTGATVRRRRWRGWDEAIDYDETLVVTDNAVDLSRMQAGAPVLESHAQWSTRSIMAVVDRAWIGGGEGRALVRFPKAGLDPEADRLFGKVADGIVRNVSVGYAIGKVRVEKPERHGEVERWFVERWTPHEISFVAIGADPGAQVRGAERAPPTFPVTFDFPGRAVRTQESSMDDDVRTDAPTGAAGTAESTTEEREAAAGGTPAAAPPQPYAIEGAERIRTEERERASAIYGLAERFRLERTFADDLVRRGVPLTDARSQVLERLAERDNRGAGLSQVSLPAGGLDADLSRREAMVEAVLHRVAPAVNALPERAREFRGMSLVDLARSCVAAAGMTVRGLTAHEIVDAALGRSRGALMLRTPPGYHGTTDFPLVLANVAGKRLRQAYQTAPRTFQRWTRGITAPDFKPLFPTQIGNFPALLPVMEGAEFSYGTIAESRETYRLGTFGRIVALTRQAIVNDDMRAFDRAINTAGMKAADLESGLVYNELLSNPLMSDGLALFSTAAGRANQGTAAGITEASLTQAIELMTQQREMTSAGLTGDQIINNFPKYILVPPGARSIEARKIIAQTTPAQASEVNPFANSFEVIEEPRLFNTAGPQRWWLAADPNSIDTIEYAHLEGQIEPFLDQRVGFEVDGVEFKIRHDFAAKAIDFRGLFFNAGV
jgi:hypothetical protein